MQNISKKINQTYTYLYINGRILYRNFDFRVIRSAESLSVTATINIQRDYFLASRITVNTNDALEIHLQNHLDIKYTVFKGTASTVSYSDDMINIQAVFNIAENEDFNETYNNITRQRALSALVPNLKYLASNIEHSLIICKDKKENSLNRLLYDLYFWIDMNQNLVVKDSPSKGSLYIIDNCTYYINSTQITIFPIPSLEIDDAVEYEGKEYIVEGIAYSLSGACQMTLDISPY